MRAITRVTRAGAALLLALLSASFIFIHAAMAEQMVCLADGSQITLSEAIGADPPYATLDEQGGLHYQNGAYDCYEGPPSTQEPTSIPTNPPATFEPTAVPTNPPATWEPTVVPTKEPTQEPTQVVTQEPSATVPATEVPTQVVTEEPTDEPTQEPGTHTFPATGGLDETCPSGQVALGAHFVITSIGNDAPSSIHVLIEGEDPVTAPLEKISGGTAHYTVEFAAGQEVSGATAELPSDWNGQFNLSHLICSAVTPTETATATVPVETPTEVTTETPEVTATVPTETATATVVPTEVSTETPVATATETATSTATVPTNNNTPTPPSNGNPPVVVTPTGATSSTTVLPITGSGPEHSIAYIATFLAVMGTGFALTGGNLRRRGF